MTHGIRRIARPIPMAVFALTLTFALPLGARAQDGALELALSSFELREIGPANMGGRVVDLAVVESNPAIFYVAYATAGLWKTTSHGMDWTPVFDDQPTASVGAVALAPSNPKIVWVGTGAANNRQSSAYGIGVFKSIDGGETWRHMGLENTRQIGRIVVHPTNPEIVYVAAAGHLWGPNPERGVYKTTDGGETWQKVLYVDENTGAIDIAMNPRAPNVLLAAMYQRRRTPWGFSADGDGSGLYRTLDGGESWVELTAADDAAVSGDAGSDEDASVVFNDRGLPTGSVGRIGLDIYRYDGSLIYALIESHDEGEGLYRSTDRGETWEKVSDQNPRPMYFSIIRIDPTNPDRLYMGGQSIAVSYDGGKTWEDVDEGVHADTHAIWIDPNNPGHVISGNDGGVVTSFNGGEVWHRHLNMAVGQFYQIDVGSRTPYYVCGGLQDNGSWCGLNRTLKEGGIRLSDWFRVGGADGFWTEISPLNPGVVFLESQNGGISRYYIETGMESDIEPIARPVPGDSSREYRFHWNSPIRLSLHEPGGIYFGANHVMYSPDGGQTWEEISPDLTRQIDRDTMPIMGEPVDENTLSGNDGVGAYGTVVEIGQSPLSPDVLYAGTDDGKLWVTRNGGESWTDLTENVPEFGHGYHVSGIEPSSYELGRVYLAFDGHRSDDYAPYVFVSQNFGEDWERITAGLPQWSVNVIEEHPETPGLLFLGNEVGAYVSVNRGESWHRLTANVPTVPVDDIVLHRGQNDLVLGTHGRSIWILDDVTPLEEIARGGVLASEVHMFDVSPANMWVVKGRPGASRSDRFEGDNPPVGVVIRYWLRQDLAPAPEPVVTASANPALALGASSGTRATAAAADAAEAADAAADPAKVQIRILNASGEVVRQLEGSGDSGIQRVVWDFRISPPVEIENADELPWWQRPDPGPRVLPGTYSIRLSAAGQTRTADVQVRLDPRIEVTDEVLAQRQSALMQAYALAGPFYRASQAVDTAQARLEAAREQLESLNSQAAEELLAEADAIEEALEEAADRVDDLEPGVLGDIQDVYGPPTADQLWLLERAWRDAPAAFEGLNEVLTERLPAFTSQVFRPAALPQPIEAIQMPERTLTPSQPAM